MEVDVNNSSISRSVINSLMCKLFGLDHVVLVYQIYSNMRCQHRLHDAKQNVTFSRVVGIRQGNYMVSSKIFTNKLSLMPPLTCSLQSRFIKKNIHEQEHEDVLPIGRFYNSFQQTLRFQQLRVVFFTPVTNCRSFHSFHKHQL